MSFSDSLLTFFLLLVGSNLGGRVQTQEKESSPDKVIKMMVERYAAVSTYQDVGVVETATVGSLPTRSTDVAFKLYFSRPGKLRFEWVELTPLALAGRNIVWSDGEKTFGSYSFEPDKVETRENLGLGLAGATGISLGSAITIPNLLVKEVGGFALTDLKRVSLKDQEQFEGEDCYVLEGFHPNGDPWEFWIGKKDFLLRKLKIRRANGEFQEEIHRDIRVNKPIPEGTFQLKVTPGGLAADIISKQKEEDIRHLLGLMLPSDRTNKLLNDVLSLMKRSMPQVPEKVWKEITDELHFNSDLLIQIYLPIYDRYYTDDEVKQLIAFYESPLGKKAVRNSFLIELEAGHHWGAIGRDLIKRINEKLHAKGFNISTT